MSTMRAVVITAHGDSEVQALPLPQSGPTQLLVEVPAPALVQGMTAHYLVRSTFPVQPGHEVLVHVVYDGVGKDTFDPQRLNSAGSLFVTRPTSVTTPQTAPSCCGAPRRSSPRSAPERYGSPSAGATRSRTPPAPTTTSRRGAPPASYWSCRSGIRPRRH
jgi:hypothetical protein